MLLWAEHTGRFPANTGIQRVTRCIARALVEGGTEVVPVKWGADKLSFVPLSGEERVHLSRWNGPKVEGLLADVGGEVKWLLVPEPFFDPYAPSFKALVSAARARGLLVAAVFYDALPYSHPAFFPPSLSRTHRIFMDELAFADVVLPISESSGRELTDYWDKEGVLSRAQAAGKVRVCPLAGEFFERPRSKEVPAGGALPLTILSLGTVEPRKNHLTLVRSFIRATEKLPGQDLRLVIAGGGTPYPRLSKELESLINAHPEAHIRWERQADDAFLERLFSECAFTVYPSVAEGFGLPIVESLWHGRPVICHNDGAILETASAGGCLLADTRSVDDLAEKIALLAGNAQMRETLSRKAMEAPLKTWGRYGQEVLSALESFHPFPPVTRLPKPLLSICVTTYNRAAWLSHSLPLILKQTQPYQDVVEVVVCDNASPDNTRDVVRGLGHYANLYYHRNEKNVGMLGNLAVSSKKGRGKYIWVIGDDDLLVEGTIERVLVALIHHPETELVYLNYSLTRFDQPQDLVDVAEVIRGARPVSQSRKDEFSLRVRDIADKSENCFTAIYCLIYREDHARRAYQQDTSGAPFSNLMTCVPTADYVCRNMFDRPGYWVGDPSVVVNLNVSWMRYASLYILERFPDLFDLMQEKGADPARIDRLRADLVPKLLRWFKEIYFGSCRENLPLFSPERLVERFGHIPAFRQRWKSFYDIYRKAFEKGLVHDAGLTPERWQELFLKRNQEVAL
jgi:glycosyltransferase involved in cell wall biosynthesis